MITVHHLNHSRSHRIVWLLEELGHPYEIAFYQRAPLLAPEELKQVHPLGKAPVLQDGALVLVESGAIIDHLIRHYGPQLQPDPSTGDYDIYVEWLHYAEGSAMAALSSLQMASRLGEAAGPIMPRLMGEVGKHLAYIDKSLEGRDYLMGDFTGADVNLWFIAKAAERGGPLSPNIKAWVDRLEARPAYGAAIARGGPFDLAALSGKKP